MKLCEHDHEKDYEVSLLNDDNPDLKYCKKCRVTVEKQDGKWVRVGGVTKATYRYG